MVAHGLNTKVTVSVSTRLGYSFYFHFLHSCFFILFFLSLLMCAVLVFFCAHGTVNMRENLTNYLMLAAGTFLVL